MNTCMNFIVPFFMLSPGIQTCMECIMICSSRSVRNRRRSVKEKRARGSKIEKLLDVFPQVIFSTGMLDSHTLCSYSSFQLISSDCLTLASQDCLLFEISVMALCSLISSSSGQLIDFSSWIVFDTIRIGHWQRVHL